MKINKILKKNKRIWCVLKVIKNFGNSQFINDICRLNNDPNKIEIKHYGKENSEKNIYLIDINDENAGFFALFRWVLSALVLSDQFGFLPVVNYSHSAYNEPVKINNTYNAFEYYFMQVSDISTEEVFKSKNVFLHSTAFNQLIEKEYGCYDENLQCGYVVTEEYLKCLARMVQKYIRLNKHTQSILDEDIHRLLYFNNKKIKALGVHMRGTDYAKKLPNHPEIISVDCYIKEIKKVMKQCNFDQVFLATEDKRILDQMKKEFKGQLIYYQDVNRADNEELIVKNNSGRENNFYLNGLEVLRDAYTLASCDGFIAGLSQVSFAVRILKYSFNETFEHIKILDKGIVRKK